jgi:hypothetical protein
MDDFDFGYINFFVIKKIYDSMNFNTIHITCDFLKKLYKNLENSN